MIKTLWDSQNLFIFFEIYAMSLHRFKMLPILFVFQGVSGLSTSDTLFSNSVTQSLSAVLRFLISYYKFKIFPVELQLQNPVYYFYSFLILVKCAVFFMSIFYKNYRRYLFMFFFIQDFIVVSVHQTFYTSWFSKRSLNPERCNFPHLTISGIMPWKSWRYWQNQRYTAQSPIVGQGTARELICWSIAQYPDFLSLMKTIPDKLNATCSISPWCIFPAFCQVQSTAIICILF